MASARRDLTTERQFGRVVGGVLLALGGWWIWRDRFPIVREAFAATGVALVTLSFLAPGLLALPNRAWMALAEVLAFVSTRVILAVVFFGVLTPIALVRRLTGADALRRRGGARSTYWFPYSARQADVRHFQKMY